MPRDDEQESDSGRGGRTAKTMQSVRSLGHGASGGHNTGAGRVPGNRSALSRTNRPLWDLDDPDYQSGGDMADYQFCEYPKHVTVHGKLHVCQNAEEEETARAGETIVRDEEERKRLVALAEVKGVQVDKRWGLPKIAKAIEDAGHDPALNPFE